MEKIRPGAEFEQKAARKPHTGLWVWLSLAAILGISFVAGAIFYVWIYIEQVQNGYRLAKLHEEYDKLLAIQRKLRLEWVRFEDPFKLEEVGKNQFGLNPPRADQKFLMR
ncbi:MAG: hypothetical protein ABFD98_11535 [Syntrophobacteraceae bacterium]|nr:hypothetical protein [Desulfobacteraceae bacterium]